MNGKIAGKASGTTLLVPLLAAVTLVALAGSRAVAVDHVSCSARSNTDPGRLNVALEQEGYGVVPPCESNLTLYIPQNTRLRSIDAIIRVSTSGDDVLGTHASRADLERTDYGMFATRIGIEPEAGKACAALSVNLEIRNCRGDRDDLIACPEVRVKTPTAFAGLSVSGDSLNICHDE